MTRVADLELAADLRAGVRHRAAQAIAVARAASKFGALPLN
jgi:hypothetical protein